MELPERIIDALRKNEKFKKADDFFWKSVKEEGLTPKEIEGARDKFISFVLAVNPELMALVRKELDLL